MKKELEKLRDQVPVHMLDIHLEKGMHCVDCHFDQDSHGNGHIVGEVMAGVEINTVFAGIGGSYHLDEGFYEDFHVYAIEWTPWVIRWYVDGKRVQRRDRWFTMDFGRRVLQPAPFDRDFHFILNIAVGGNWPGAPNGATVFPVTMEVDYVRVYSGEP